MITEGLGHLFSIYCPGFVCFVCYKAKISGERLQDHWSSGFTPLSNDLNICIKLNRQRQEIDQIKF